MTNTLKHLGAFGGLLVLVISSVPIISSAAEFRFAEEASFRQNEQLADDLYLAGGTVTTAGSVTGDITAAGGNILLDGSVSADVLLSGGTVTLLAPVGGDVRMVAGNAIIKSDIGGDLLIGGGQVSLSGPRIGGDAIVGAGSIRIESPIMGDARLAGGEVWINAPIAGSVFIKAERVSFGPEGRIMGNLSYAATKQADIATSTVLGTISYEPQPDVRSAAKAGMTAFLSLWAVATILMLLVGALFFGLFFLSYSTKLVRSATEAPLISMGYGVLFLIVTPILSILLMSSVVALPLGLLGLIGYVGALIFVWLFSPVVVGSVLYRWWMGSSTYDVSWWTILIGVLFLSIIGLVPVLGALAKFLVFLLTLGAMIKFKWDLAREWR